MRSTPGDAMDAIRLRLFQQLASYRMPGSYVIRQSYPLPPYSSVIGMIHTACGFTDYVGMKVSVQGDFASGVSEPFTYYAFNNGMKFDPTRHTHKLRSELKPGTDIGLTRGMQHIELLVDVELLIHILPDDPAMLSVIAAGLKKPERYLSLGRHEDIVRVDEVSIIKLGECDYEDGVTFHHSAFVPQSGDYGEGLKSLNGTRYRLGKRFETPNASNKLKTRKWLETVNALYVGKRSTAESVMLPVDSIDGIEYPVLFA